MPVTFQVVGNLADFGNDPRAGVKVHATASPGVKVGDVAVHSNEPETVVTDAAGAFTLELVSLPGVWYTIRTPYSNAMNTVRLAGYVPDVGDPTTGTVFPANTVINLKDVVSEDPTPGYEAIAYVGGGGGGGGYLDHGDQSGAVSYAATIGTHALTMVGDTAVTLGGGADGSAVYITATGAYVLTVEGLVIPTGRALALRVRGAWELYVLGGDGDTTAPAAGTLTVTYPGTGSSLVVAGASDAGVGLHAAPYAFRQNGGAWTAWQSSPTYTAFAVTPLTSYTWQHKVRDARGTEAVGEAVTSSTPAASTWTTLFSDSFGGAAGVINGRAVETGTGSWARISGTNDITVTGAGVAQWDTHGQSADAIVNIPDQARIRWTVDYDVSAHTTGWSKSVVGVGAGTNSATSNQLYVNVTCSTSGNNATLTLTDNAAGVWTITAAAGQALTGHPAVGTMVVDLDGANRGGTVSINGTLVGNITGDTAVTIFTAYLRLSNSTAKVGAVALERYGI